MKVAVGMYVVGGMVGGTYIVGQVRMCLIIDTIIHYRILWQLSHYHQQRWNISKNVGEL